MKDYDKYVIWLDYFDSSLTRSSGRRVPSHSATRSPTLQELRSAAERLGLNAAVQEARRPSSGRLTGYIQVTKFGRKADLIKKLSAELGRLRSEFRRDEGAQKALPRR